MDLIVEKEDDISYDSNKSSFSLSANHRDTPFRAADRLVEQGLGRTELWIALARTRRFIPNYCNLLDA